MKMIKDNAKLVKLYYILSVITALVIMIAGLWFLQKLLVPKYQKGVVEGSMIQEYYQSEVPHEVLFDFFAEVRESTGGRLILGDDGSLEPVMIHIIIQIVLNSCFCHDVFPFSIAEEFYRIMPVA